MKFSLKLAQFYNPDLAKGVNDDDLISKFGKQLGAIETVESYREIYHGVRTVKVVSVKPHPNADKLKVCLVDDKAAVKDVDRDDNGLVRVVCGAPNVRAGMWALWLPPGSTVPESAMTNKEFKLEARELRGVVSSGMLASERELAISEEHDGILDLAEFADRLEKGDNVDVVGELGLTDLVLDFENKMFTHRPDCFGNLGIARELAGIYGKEHESPDWYIDLPDFDFAKSESQSSVEVVNSIHNLVPRFMAVALDSVEIKSSPTWLKAYIYRLGYKPVNNVVDATNYVMHLLGQPMHAFDYDKLLKVAGVGEGELQFGPDLASQGESIELLGDKKIKLHKDDIVIRANGKAVALGGIMGGKLTEVDSGTTRVLLECATFNMYSVRRSSMRHGLFTDAAIRYTKNQSTEQNDRAVWYFTKLLAGYAGAKLCSNLYDLHKNSSKPDPIGIDLDFINLRLGLKLEPSEIAKLLQNVEFRVTVSGESIEVTPPFWRTDVKIAEDVVEEVGRLNGYDKIPVLLPVRAATVASSNQLIINKQQIRTRLEQMGANELLTYSFVKGDVLKQAGIDPDETCFEIRNALSPSLRYYRPTLLPSLLEKVHPNIKLQAGGVDNKFALYELGKTHIKDAIDEATGLPIENHRLALVFSADQKSALSYSGAAYYQANHYLETIAGAVFEYRSIGGTPLASKLFEPARAAEVWQSGEFVGVLGQPSRSLLKSLKLPGFTSMFEVDLDMLNLGGAKEAYRPISNFPGLTQDVTLSSMGNSTWADVTKFVTNRISTLAAKQSLHASVEPGDIYSPDGAVSTNYSYKISFVSMSRTLTTGEVGDLMTSLVRAAEQEFDLKVMS